MDFGALKPLKSSETLEIRLSLARNTKKKQLESGWLVIHDAVEDVLSELVGLWLRQARYHLGIQASLRNWPEGRLFGPR